MREQFKKVRGSLIYLSVFLIVLSTITLLINRVGIDDKEKSFKSEDVFCQIDLDLWYIEYSIIVGVKLLLTFLKYFHLKKYRSENVLIALADLILINLLLTALFVHANIMYHSKENNCYFTSNKYIKFFYFTFCLFTFLGYL